MPAVIPAVAAIGGAYIASRGAKDAANTQAASADRAEALQQEQYEQTRQDQAPWRAAGTTALSSLTAGLQPGGKFARTFTMNDYQSDPGYQFRLSEGEKGINSAAIARGSRYSGATLKALNRFNSDQASQEYGKAYDRFNNDNSTIFNRYASIAGLGQTATNQTAAAGAQAAGQIGQAIQDAGTARASGYVGAGNAVNGALGQLGNYYSLSSMLPGAGSAALQGSSLYASTVPAAISGYVPSAQVAIPSLPAYY